MNIVNYLKCNHCGNTKKFYRDISATGKLRINNKGENLKTVYDMNKHNFDNYFEIIRCCECGKEVWDEVDNGIFNPIKDKC